jgi:predicted transposase/invertase (TIGR01784 family)
VVVLITSFSELAGRRFHSTFRAQERHDGEALTDHLELHVLELPKLQAAIDRNDEPNLTAWATFLAATTDEELNALAMENPVLKQAKDALDRLSADPAARDRAEQREMALLTYEAGLAKVRREGREEGKAEGREEGKAELFRHLLTLKFGTLPAKLTARVANASGAELLRWSERVLTADTLATIFETDGE